MALVRAVLRKCVNDWQVLASAPKVPMYRPKPTEPRFLSHDEFGRLCKELPEHLRLAARFAVLTGLRMRSMLAMTWDRIDLKAATAWIPGEHMKAGRTHGLTLSPDAVKVLKDLRRFVPDGNAVFQYDGVQIADANTAAFKKAVERAGVGPRCAGMTCATRGHLGRCRTAQRFRKSCSSGDGSATAWCSVTRISRRITWQQPPRS
jgi:integrase